MCNEVVFPIVFNKINNLFVFFAKIHLKFTVYMKI
jgi:hypothetical protein